MVVAGERAGRERRADIKDRTAPRGRGRDLAANRWRSDAAQARVPAMISLGEASMRLLFAVLLSILSPSSTWAAEGAEPSADRLTDIPVEEWAGMATGRTLSYSIDGELWALERYYHGTNRVTLQFFDGSCLEGVWEYEAPLYCFHWEAEGTSCFRHVRQGDEILILETRDGVETGAVQVMSGVGDTPLACGTPLTS
jgi:hypothetical protein